MKNIAQMPVILIPVHFDRDPVNRIPSCSRSIVLRPFETNDFMTGLPTVPGSEKLPITVSLTISYQCNSVRCSLLLEFWLFFSLSPFMSAYTGYWENDSRNYANWWNHARFVRFNVKTARYNWVGISTGHQFNHTINIVRTKHSHTRIQTSTKNEFERMFKAFDKNIYSSYMLTNNERTILSDMNVLLMVACNALRSLAIQ